ncbi:hydrogenase maturation protease [Rhodococcus sp. TAF43]|uniref:hydrogenase maturation protease n=1 Tax=unclassified Rhodococcus (in: high G+C Gram-positive bacteria) TaxID=192944 RepID=UPI000E0A8AD5|nr:MULTISPECIES: hydrogenase maturation protease [unclassified Rhodococcus (in: high G+C Gram-positive bacteria)]QKT13358.1 hydrogenase maturation protease [Rhodococcus sp. W8901]RDI14707.1 hydrogenase maturation protease [Rhodococcus sp. AG1013]
MTSAPPRVLLAGIGNIFLGDDGFGPAVLKAVAGGPLPAGVRAVDYGIRGMHLAYDLLDGWDGLILVDAVPDRGTPGAVRAFEVGREHPDTAPQLDAHGMDPASVFASLAALGGTLPRTVVVGCQVRDVDEGIGLSAPVARAVPAAADVVRAVLADLGAGVGVEG